MLPGVEVSDNVVTYEEQILDENLPGSIIIAGSGAIGVEFAYVMANFGVDVTIVEFLDRMVPAEDADVSKELAQALQEARREGAARAQGRVEDTGSGVKVTVAGGAGGDSRSSRPTSSSPPSASPRAPRAMAWRTSASSSPTAAPSRSTSSCVPTSTTSMRSVTAPAKMMLAHVAEARASSRPRPSQVPRPCRSTTT
jgi:dihydrolipoamide dehydrogenase